jgi:broad specificity polyphosphatase/5'/3'-nucleotidase SurE
VGANPIVNVNVPHQELLIPQNKVQIDQAEMVAENEAEMNFSFEEEEDPEEDPNSYWEEGEFRPNDH